jgi:hypothetical protein
VRTDAEQPPEVIEREVIDRVLRRVLERFWTENAIERQPRDRWR